MPIQWLMIQDKFTVPISLNSAQRYIATGLACIRFAFYSKMSIHTWFQVLMLYNLSSATTTALSGLLLILNGYVDTMEKNTKH